MPDETSKLKRAFNLHQQGQLEQAAVLYQEILQIQPRQTDALQLLATLEVQRKNHAEAVNLFDRALMIDSNNANALNNRGIALRALGRIDEALESYDRAIACKPDYAESLYNRGNVLRDMRRFDAALESYEAALTFNPNHAEAHNNCGMALRELERFQEAIKHYDHALRLKINYADALNNKGIVLRDLKRFDAALEHYDQALNIDPNHVDTLSNRAIVLSDLNRLDEALDCYEQALAKHSNHAGLLNNRGVLLHALERNEEAIASYALAFKIKPDYAEAFFNCGNALRDLRRNLEAIKRYTEALSITPDDALVLYARGNALLDLDRFDAALDDFERALKLDPDAEFLYGIYLHTKLQVCDWSDHEHDWAHLIEKHEQKISPPFQCLALSDEPALQRKVAESYVQAKHPFNPLLGEPPKGLRHEKIRIGYFSADFHNHATAYLMAGLFEKHDKSRFELFAFSFGPEIQDEMRQRLMNAFDRFIDVQSLSDKAIALLARSLEIDIAIDLKGFTLGNRTGLFAMRAAPIQVSYLGYPGTMGAGYIDYLIADSTLIPESHQAYYTEKIVYLPHSYQVNDDLRPIADQRFNRADFGLPQKGFVFCCFNNSYKISPDLFDVWMRLLHRIENSVLWLIEDNAPAVKNLKMAAEQRGVCSDRLVFAKRMPLSEHLARHRLADLFLDTLPYNAHTTASDALWVGLPVLTCMGQSFAGRVAASLLKAMNLAELIASDLEVYEAYAVELAHRPELLMKIRQKLADNRLTTPLFNTELFARHIEASYRAMYERYRAGLSPEAIYVEDKATMLNNILEP